MRLTDDSGLGQGVREASCSGSALSSLPRPPPQRLSIGYGRGWPNPATGVEAASSAVQRAKSPPGQEVESFPRYICLVDQDSPHKDVGARAGLLEGLGVRPHSFIHSFISTPVSGISSGQLETPFPGWPGPPRCPHISLPVSSSSCHIDLLAVSLRSLWIFAFAVPPPPNLESSCPRCLHG